MKSVEERTHDYFKSAVESHFVEIAERFQDFGTADDFLKLLLDESAEFAMNDWGGRNEP